ncbi:hypothetical protein [Solibacillus isronensis]|uniref:hypothetical protein n=1 Tax=Solibacillus isronensis TaxID=412383 RepID=UPI0039A14D41
MDALLPITERVPVEETLQVLEYIKYERDKKQVRQYIEDILPFSETTKAKYRQRIYERYLVFNGEEVVYTPFIKYVNEVESYQIKKELLFYMTAVSTETLQVILKDISSGVIKEKFTKTDFKHYLTERMTTSKPQSVDKTLSVITTILKDFNILTVKEDSMNKESSFFVNDRFRPSYETIAFCLYFEFFEIQDNRILNVNTFKGANTFKYFLMNPILSTRYTKWLIEKGYLEHFKMGTNEQYQITSTSLEDFVEKVIENA